ncbi:unnamed protein product [Arctogadus glacialis]
MDSSDEASEMSLVEGIGEQAARLRAARSGKMSHLTRRMNIMNNLMVGNEYLEELRGNLTKFEEMLDSFQTLHSNYAQFLDEEARKEDNEAWYKPRRMQIIS